MSEEELGIYVHIPFCVRKCIYCDFLSFHADLYNINKYFNSLYNEIDQKKHLIQDKIITSVFIGGGTPSIVPPLYINKLMNKLKNSFKFHNNIEVTIEVNPGTVNKESFRIYKESYINRISFGLQSMDNNTLKFLRRIHTKEDFIRSLNYAREEGFHNINADLLMGVPNQSINIFANTLKEACDLSLPHISCYSLILEPDTILYKMIEADEVGEPEDLIDREMYHICKDYLVSKQYAHYEISNFAKEGYTCNHNMLYWNCDEYLGLGLGSSSYLFNERYKNTSGFKDYLSYDFKKYESEYLNEYDKMNEFMMLGFRLTNGPDPLMFYNRFNRYYHIEFSDKLKILEKTGLICQNKNTASYCLTEKGLDLANQVFMEFV